MSSSGGRIFFPKGSRQMNTMFVGDEEHIIVIDIIILMFINYWVILIQYPIILQENIRREWK
jgi:hypothetical protein